MKRNLLFLFILFSPFFVLAYDNGVYEVLDGEAKTVKYNDIELTIKMEDEPGNYVWGVNEEFIYKDPGDKNRSEFEFKKGKENDNAWGGGDDNYENYFDSLNDRKLRQGPCDDGWHVPSMKEWSDFVLARCFGGENDCIEDDISWKARGKLIHQIQRYELETLADLRKMFVADFNFKEDQVYWSSSPRVRNGIHGTARAILPDVIYSDRDASRDSRRAVRCFKNSVSYEGAKKRISVVPDTENKEIDNSVEVSQALVDYENKADTKRNPETKQEEIKQEVEKNITEEIKEETNKKIDEFQKAYNFAFNNGITTIDKIENADMNGGLNRIAMAKMLSNYAVNILGKKPANIIVPNFPDVSEELNENYGGAVDLAYQLGIMGIGTDKFRPYDSVTRAEFATALSRMLYGLEDGIDNYYSTHIDKLYQEGIISNKDPDLKELRGYVMLMLMRSYKAEENTVTCTMEYNPVCGKNGKKYGNKCFMEIDGVEESQSAKIVNDECVYN